jgi:hypothetical protein
MKAQRRFYEAHPGLGMVGGEVELWTLSRKGLNQRVAYRFSDRDRADDLLARIESGAEPLKPITERLFSAAEMREAAAKHGARPPVAASSSSESFTDLLSPAVPNPG